MRLIVATLYRRTAVNSMVVASCPMDAGNRCFPSFKLQSLSSSSSNQRMAAVPAGNRAEVGTYNHAHGCHSVFSLSWVWTCGYDGRAVSAHGKKTGYVRLGKLALNMPMVTFRGNELSEEVGNILTAEFLDGCT